MSTDKTPKMKLWLRIVLVASLGVNLVVVGLAAGAMIRFHDQDRSRPAPFLGAMLFRELDKDTRRELRQMAGGDHGNMHERRRAESAKVLELLRADPFDADALTVYIREQASSGHEFQMSVQQAWIARIGAMDAEERVEYADHLQEKMQRPHGGKRRRSSP